MFRRNFLGSVSVVSLFALLVAACSSSSEGGSADAGSSGSSSGSASGSSSGSALDGASAAETGSTSGDATEAGTGAQAGSDAATTGSRKDAAASGGSEGGAAAGCAGSSALLCEDFESGTINASTWKQSTQNGTLTVDGTHAHSGTHALHVHVSDDGGATAQITETKTFPAASKALFGRAMMWMDAPAPQAHVEYVGANSASGNESYTFGSQYATVLSLAYVGSEMGNHQDDNPLPTGQWACYEWQFDGSTGDINLWLNGKALTDIDMHLGSSASVTFASLDIGMLMFGSDGSTPAAFDAWYDDIEVGTSRIGCP